LTLNITIALMEQVGELAKKAGLAIMDIYNTDFEVEQKSDSSPVTEADRVAEEIITQGIREGVTAQYPIVGEEAFAAGQAPEVGDGPFWLIDALDGTKSFISKSHEFTVVKLPSSSEGEEIVIYLMRNSKYRASTTTYNQERDVVSFYCSSGDFGEGPQSTSVWKGSDKIKLVPQLK